MTEAPISPLRRRMIEDMTMRRFAPRTQEGYIRAVKDPQGGDHTALNLRINGAGKHRWTVLENTLSLIRELARLMPDQQIARPRP